MNTISLEARRSPHELVLSDFLLDETARVLRYPRLRKLFQLTDQDINEHVSLLRGRADLVLPVIQQEVVLADPNDDPVVFTAVDGRADVLCAMDRDFYAPNVISFCQERGIEILNDVQLLHRLTSQP